MIPVDLVKLCPKLVVKLQFVALADQVQFGFRKQLRLRLAKFPVAGLHRCMLRTHHPRGKTESTFALRSLAKRRELRSQ